MTSNEIREKFIKFLEEKGHKLIAPAPLVPENDPTVLFTTAGMHPLIPYLLGEKHPEGKLLVNIQPCLRTDDIEEVGDNQHLTFFEMMGYWSLGDRVSADGIGSDGYFKKESIHFTFDFFTEVLGFDKDKISVTVFAGDDDAPFDKESYDTWKDEIKISEERIYKYSKVENWWGPAGETGPCGPCTEMFIDTGIKACGKDCGPSCHCDKFVEIGNNVFMEYNKTAEGKFEKLAQKNVDVGLGLERLTMLSQKKNSVFETDLFEPIIKLLKTVIVRNQHMSLRGAESDEAISGVGDVETASSLASLAPRSDKSNAETASSPEAPRSDKNELAATRIITDHIRAAVFVLREGVEPSNKLQGYVLRRLIRRAIVKGQQLGIEKNFTKEIAGEVIEIYKDIYEFNQEKIIAGIEAEEEKFRKTLKLGLKKFQEAAKQKKLEGSDLFDLFQTYGFPIDLSLEVAAQEKIAVAQGAEAEFQEAFKKHQEKSRTASAGMFKGGLADAGPQTIKLHTAAHLMLAALRQVLGDQVVQKGSNITPERLRFDFSHPEKMTDEQIKKVEDLVNQEIKEDLPVEMKEMTVEEAKKTGAMGVFDERYGEKVKVYTINDFSKEICGGPHVKRTGELGHFKILKEESSSAGVRRIKAEVY